jgi:hypothetical protein
MPLCIITNVTTLNISFYVAFVFLSSELTENYEWMLHQLLQLYQSLAISDSLLIAIDCEVALINAIKMTFPSAKHVLCL